MKTPDLTLENNSQHLRYEAKQGEAVVAFAEYRLVASAVMFTHTEVEQNQEGRGIGSELIRFALEDVKAKGLIVIPMCPFVAAYIQRHLEEYLSLVHPQHRKIFGL